MKIGDKIRYEGGMNPECKAYKYIQFDIADIISGNTR